MSRKSNNTKHFAHSPLAAIDLTVKPEEKSANANARLLAIDYGTKRTGIAVTDPLQLIANGLTTVRSHELLQFLENYCASEKVEKFIIGMPRTLRNEAAENAKYVNIFAKQCAQKFPHIPIIFVDERFTSTIAHQTMRAAGLKKTDRQNKELVDTISATIILQSYMEQKNNML